MNWVKNGESMGTEGFALRAEAIHITITKKGINFNIDTLDSFLKKETQKKGLFLPVGSCGVDLSYWDGYDVDFDAAKADGVDWVICRISDGIDTPDSSFVDNINRAREAGLPVGAYMYIRANSVEEAEIEAAFAIEKLQNAVGKFPAGVWADLEGKGQESIANVVINTWCSALENAGYIAGFYCNYNWMTNYISDYVKNRWARWMAQYNVPSPGTDCQIWQYTEKGTVSGIPPDCDMNVVISQFSEEQQEPGVDDTVIEASEWESYVSPHFQLKEFYIDDGYILPVRPVQALIDGLEEMRAAHGGPISITSGVRSVESNNACGGVPDSLHLTGEAADIVIDDMTSDNVYYLYTLAQSVGLGTIRYSNFLHVQTWPRDTVDNS
jgi:GH25 family lysozyme M1 (1,4-beta-N-acetylmuramidase)